MTLLIKGKAAEPFFPALYVLFFVPLLMGSILSTCTEIIFRSCH